MHRPRLLDLFCGAGGAAMGYHRAGFEVVGVDIAPQPNYPFRFMQGDALESWRFDWDDWDAIHASPPCQAFTALQRTGVPRADHPDFIEATRQMLQATDLPWVIENVPGAPLENPIQLCGTGFGLGVQRHRLFETNFSLMSPGCSHGRNGAQFPAATNRGKDSRRTVEIGVWRIPVAIQQEAMGIDWMTLEELSAAIPPAYTEHIGCYLVAEVERRRAFVST